MNLTVGFIALFLTLVLPGMIFRRMYFLGEFSKQVSTSEPVVRTLLYAIIPSAIIQILCLSIYDKWISPIDLDLIIDTHKNLIRTDYSFGENQQDIKKLLFGEFIWYSLGVYVFAGVSGLGLYFLVRFAKLDIRFKIFRFKNQWAYTFSGEISYFKKFRRSHKKHPQKEGKRFKRLLPFADVLVRKTQDLTTMYSGFIIDYELKPDKLHEIDRLYLSEARKFEDSKHSRTIPGEYLILFGENILNINVNYVYKEISEEELSAKKRRRFDTVKFLLIFSLIISFPLFFIHFQNVDAEIYAKFFQLPWYKRLFTWYSLYSSYSILFPFKKSSDKDKKYEWIGIEKLYHAFIPVTIIYIILFFWVLIDLF